MSRFPRIAVLVLASLLATPALADPAPAAHAAASATATTPGTQADASATATAPAAGASDTKAPAGAAAVEKRLAGTWKIVLDDEQKKELATMQLAFRDPPPTQDELAKLDKQDATVVGMVLMARKKNPDDPQLAKMKAMMLGLADTTLTFGNGKLTMGLGTMHLGGPYSVTSVDGDKVTIHHTDDKGKVQDIPITFDGNDTIILTGKKGQETRFQRQR